MENNVQPEDIAPEFCRVEIKEEFFDLIEEESCIGETEEENGLVNEIKEDASIDVKQDQSFTSDILNEENILVNQIKTEDLNNIDVNKDQDLINEEEEEIDYIWPEDVQNKTDPLALLEIKYETELENSKEEETVASDSLPESSTQKDSELLGIKVHDSRGKQHNKEKSCILSTSGNLEQHTRLHKCSVCEYACSHSSNLKRHMRHHTGERPFKCNICDYASSTSTYLKTHMRKHTGQKPYKCDICNYATSKSGYLKIHMRRHSGELPYKCNVCYYASSTSTYLKMHMRLHTGERPYKCNVCDYASPRLNQLKIHTKKHHT